MASSALTQRPDCEQEKCAVKRIVSGGTGLIFKGSGFYLTDYKNKDKTAQPNDKKEKKEKPKTDTKKKARKTVA
jgi:predicted nucleic acid-binding Zn ribbon protein